MRSLLVEDAISKVWCTPEQDKQVILKPVKVSPYGGVWNTVRIFDRSVVLPIIGVKFHVYQVGNLFPDFIGLPDSDNVWTKISDACNLNKVLVDIYTAKGYQLPKTNAWFTVTKNGSLLLAVKENPVIGIDLNTTDLFFRFYTNAFFNSSRADHINDIIHVNGGIVYVNADILAFQNEVATHKALVGSVYCFVNGFFVDNIDLITAKPGDYVEYVYDSSVKNVITLDFANLRTFHSDKDSAIKYLLHYAGNSPTIDYCDDVDFFIIKKNGARYTGAYYHKNMVDAIRMVTHKDYSMNAAYAEGYIASIPTAAVIGDLSVMIVIRKAGYNRSLIYENNRIEELYKLPDNLLLDAMVGINATMPNWTAAHLENSPYVTLMGSKIENITDRLAQDAYGYNLISKILADTPVNNTAVSGTPTFNVPPGLMDACVVYEYNANGLLLGHYQHLSGLLYNAVNPTAAKAEMILGHENNGVLDEVFDTLISPIEAGIDYRFYICDKVGGVSQKNWRDVTGDQNKYLISNGVVQWNLNLANYRTLVRSNKNILSYDLDLMAENGVLKFSLNESVNVGGVITSSVMEVPMGELDLFMGSPAKGSLIEGIDYIVNFPQIVIINKSLLNNVLTTPQKITVRFTGFCNPDLTMNTPGDIGFIKYDLLSRNSRYDVRDDKVLRIVVAGKLYSRDMLLFSEKDNGVTVPNVNNGLPYSVRDIVVPLRNNGVDDTYTARAASKVIDQRVSDYMSLYLPEPVINTPNAILAQYQVVSPFCSKIIYDLAAGLITDPRLMGNYSDMDVKDICTPYEWLLAFDPTQLAHKADTEFVVVLPHNLDTVISLDIYKYQFLSRVVHLYMNGMISLSNFINLA